MYGLIACQAYTQYPVESEKVQPVNVVQSVQDDGVPAGTVIETTLWPAWNLADRAWTKAIQFGRVVLHVEDPSLNANASQSRSTPSAPIGNKSGCSASASTA